VAAASVSPLFDRLRLAASFVVAARLQPGGGSGGEPWRPPADLRTPRVVTAKPTPRPGPAGPSTLEEVLWAAYASAADGVRDGCHLPVTLLAAIGEVESSSLRGRSLDAGHDVVPPVLGPRLTGGAFAAIRDSDGGQLDGDAVWDRAVGPMQFIPGTWRIWGADGNGDGVANPQNIEDATLAAARYLCAGGRDLARGDDLREAVLSYNQSRAYLATVLGLVEAMTNGLDAGP
jgi:membrane-bound lytic murein transglycosylase B